MNRWRCLLCGIEGIAATQPDAAQAFSTHYQDTHQPPSRYGTNREEHRT